MQQRKISSGSFSGRPSGTDGSDFSYRMVVDSRYTMVALGKSRLYALFIFQAFIQLTRVLCTYLSTSKDETLNAVAFSPPAICFLSLIIGELGRRQSKVSFLKFYMAASSIAILLWIASVDRNSYSLKAIQDLGNWKMKKLEVLEIGYILLGVLVQIYTIITTVSLIRNMRPPKKAS